jgi:mycothiol synthase
VSETSRRRERAGQRPAADPTTARRTVRPAAACDLPAITALGHAAVDLGDYPDTTHDEVRRTSVGLAAEPSAVFVALEGGRVVGYLAPRINDLYVERDHRRRGHATALVEAALPYAREVLRHPYLLLYVPPGDTSGRRFAEARGFSYRASLHWMERPADDPAAEPVFPPGFVVRTWDRSRDSLGPFVGLLNESFVDHPTPVAWSETVIRAVHDAPDFDAEDLLIVAPTADPELPIAFCRTRLYSDDLEPHGEVKLIGVLPSWRGRGLGRALLRWGIRRLQGRGVPTIALAVSAANAHALALYEAHGFRRTIEWPQWSREA